MPFVLIRTISTFFFRAAGVSLEVTGLTSLYGLPWILKFLWAPYLDFYESKRKWLLFTQAILVLLFGIIALLCLFSWSIPFIALFFFLASIVAATHDTAIDGYYLEALDKDGQAKFVGYRVMAYRIAMMFGSGVIVTLGARTGWFWAFLVSVIIFAGLYVFHFYRLPHVEEKKESIKNLLFKAFTLRFLFLLILWCFIVLVIHSFYQKTFLVSLPLASLVGILLLFSLFFLILLRKHILSYIRHKPDSNYAQAFLSFIDREKITSIIFFIILVRAGEFMLSAMLGPFFIDIGFKDHYGWINGIVGLPCSILGAMAGGWMIAKYSLRKMIWPFLLAQNITNLAYMLLAFLLPLIIGQSPASTPEHSLSALLFILGVSAFDHLAGGLGTAVLMTFLMGLCRGKFKAAHYAIGTGLMSVSAVYAGSFSGFLVNWLGYAAFFGTSFIFSLPGMFLIFFLPANSMGATKKLS